jgi:hypothetical protein
MVFLSTSLTKRFRGYQRSVAKMAEPLIGVLALQGAFEEHQKCLEAVGCRTVQVRDATLSCTNVDRSFASGYESILFYVYLVFFCRYGLP